MKVISVIGQKNTGKTTFISHLVDRMSKLGRVGTVKLMLDHRFNPPNTDTGKHFDAGADMVTAVTESELVTIGRNNRLETALESLADAGMDFAIVEGGRDSALAKIILGEMDDPEDISNIVRQLPPRSDWDMDEIVSIVNEQTDHITLSLLVNQVKANPDLKKVGGIGTFTGIVREQTTEIRTSRLEFETYEQVARDRIEQIRTDMMQREGIIDVRIHHKIGKIGPGEDIVYIVVAAAHRTELFQALSDTLERVKTEVPIWKKEITIDGDFWVHDHA
ncbi:MAG: molybdopterin synthase [Methanosarcinaceae archaeon]|nr:molybdopterin synthase [Methanosarcinaceae archaeon]